ncbi:MAG: SGNH/GDSL hydrolase family protein [Leptospiraceae bacterium]|nr:SGNH/GDSL hydrolase family protein [Leptospiraceae bacterium]MCP5494704.1 SGNH/GDSL hydrolase family protein [Leptospiraceae bacterium]
MNDFHKFYKDKRFYVPVLVLIIFEILLQLGFYKPFLKKNSYAANVNRIANHVIKMSKVHDPDILVLGTSVAYQGLSVTMLNDKLKTKGLKLQSIAVPGSELITQQQVFEEVIPHFKKPKLLLHVVEVTMPWVAQENLMLPTLAMIAEFDRVDAIRKIYQQDYDLIEYPTSMNIYNFKDNWKKFMDSFSLKVEDISYILIRSIAYRRDMREFIISPGPRFRYMFKHYYTEPNLDIPDYENEYTEKISSYFPIQDLDDCKVKTGPANTDPIPPDSSPEHKKALFDTCSLALVTTVEANETYRTQLYFKRLKLLYDEIQKHGIKTVVVMAPYSSLLSHLGGKERLAFWAKKLEEMNIPLVNLQFITHGKNNGDYYYDLIHLNKHGKELFSNELNNVLLENVDTWVKK